MGTRKAEIVEEILFCPSCNNHNGHYDGYNCIDCWFKEWDVNIPVWLYLVNDPTLGPETSWVIRDTVSLVGDYLNLGWEDQWRILLEVPLNAEWGSTQVEIRYTIDLPKNPAGDDEIYFQDDAINYKLPAGLSAEQCNVLNSNTTKIKWMIRATYYREQ